MTSRTMIAGALAVSAAVILAGCSTAPTPTPTVTVTVRVTEEAQLQGVVDLIDKFTDPVTLPDVVGLPLDEARTELRDAGVLLIGREDASGQSRTVLIASNWLVCAQEPAAGEEASKAGTVTLFAVKKDETCPASVG